MHQQSPPVQRGIESEINGRVLHSRLGVHQLIVSIPWEQMTWAGIRVENYMILNGTKTKIEQTHYRKCFIYYDVSISLNNQSTTF